MKKTRLCQEFVNTGACKYGVKCTFAHGEVELRAVNPAAVASISMPGGAGAGSNLAASEVGDGLRVTCQVTCQVTRQRSQVTHMTEVTGGVSCVL